MAKKTVRLACINCDREDFDGITPQQLIDLKGDPEGWSLITEHQSYRDSRRTYSPEKAPPGYSIFEWYTHLGTCPECRDEYEG